jgi:hypothetical protein
LYNENCISSKVKNADKKGRKTNRQTKVKVFPKDMSKDYTIYTKCKQTKAKKLKMSNRLKILFEKRVILIKSNIDIRYLG